MDRSLQGLDSADRAHGKLLALGYTGSERPTRRAAIAQVKAAWRLGHTRVHSPCITEPGMCLQDDFGHGPRIGGVKTMLSVTTAHVAGVPVRNQQPLPGEQVLGLPPWYKYNATSEEDVDALAGASKAPVVGVRNPYLHDTMAAASGQPGQEFESEALAGVRIAIGLPQRAAASANDLALRAATGIELAALLLTGSPLKKHAPGAATPASGAVQLGTLPNL